MCGGRNQCGGGGGTLWGRRHGVCVCVEGGSVCGVWRHSVLGVGGTVCRGCGGRVCGGEESASGGWRDNVCGEEAADNVREEAECVCGGGRGAHKVQEGGGAALVS